MSQGKQSVNVGVFVANNLLVPLGGTNVKGIVQHFGS